MQFDPGLQGLGILTGVALAIGLVAPFVGPAGTRGDWLIAASAWFSCSPACSPSWHRGS